MPCFELFCVRYYYYYYYYYCQGLNQSSLDAGYINYASHIPYWLFMIVFYILLLLLLYDIYVSCHRPFLPVTSLEPAVIPTAHASSFTLQYFPYYV